MTDEKQDEKQKETLLAVAHGIPIYIHLPLLPPPVKPDVEAKPDRGDVPTG